MDPVNLSGKIDKKSGQKKQKTLKQDNVTQTVARSHSYIHVTQTVARSHSYIHYHRKRLEHCTQTMINMERSDYLRASDIHGLHDGDVRSVVTKEHAAKLQESDRAIAKHMEDEISPRKIIFEDA
jgi:hypothetical protein